MTNRCFRIAAATVLTVSLGAAQAASTTVFGDFADFFSSISYTSADGPPSGFFLFDAPVTGLAKFDPALGTLTDIIVTIGDSGPPAGPVFLSLSADIAATQADIEIPFSASAMVTGDAGLYYLTMATADTIFADFFDISASCGGGFADLVCADGGGVGGTDGEISGTTSIFGLVDPADFVGAGEFVETLVVGLFIETAATFTALDNVLEATLDVSYDVFAGTSALPTDPVIELTYVYTPVPLPGALLLFAPVAAGLAFARRRS